MPLVVFRFGEPTGDSKHILAWFPPSQWRHISVTASQITGDSIVCLEKSTLCIAGSLKGEFTDDQWIPSQRASKADMVSISWRPLSCFTGARVLIRLSKYQRITSEISVRDDVIKWKHFPRYWPLVRRIHRSVNPPHKGQWRGALMFSLICAWINRWVNNREAGDLRRHRAHYDVTVMGQIAWIHWKLEHNQNKTMHNKIACIFNGIHYISLHITDVT